MSRAYNARRKAKQKQARTAREDTTAARRLPPRRLVALAPALVIVGILAAVGILGLGGSSSGIDREQIQQRVSTLLADIPQRGTTLGSPTAPITLQVFADLECPTVKKFVTAYLPSIINTWVRDGTVKIDYRSLKTDTVKERIFYRQEAAALAAGKQNKMWNFVLTFVHEQGVKGTNYATDAFLADIATQVPSLNMKRWRKDRPLLGRKVARDLHFANTNDLRFTPALLVDPSDSIKRHADGHGTGPLEAELEATLIGILGALIDEARGDVPTLGVVGDQNQIRKIKIR